MRVDADIDPRGVATVTVRNAAKLNTLNSAMLRALVSALEQLRADDRLRAVILAGEGDRAFIGGADITEMATLNPETARAFIGLIHAACAALRALPVPVIARLRGYTLGAGMEVAAACDLRVAASDAHFGMPEVRIGIPSVVEAALLPYLIGWGRTRMLLLTGDTISAQVADQWGFLTELAAPDDVDGAIERLIASILASGRHALRIQKALMLEWENLPISDAIARGVDAFASAWDSDEPGRMMTGFLIQLRARRANR